MNCRYEFPNGYHNSFGVERYSIPELLFDPLKAESTTTPDVDVAAGGAATAEASGGQPRGVHQLIRESVDSCDIDIHNNMWTSIVLTGGATLYDGFVDRLTSELANPKNVPVTAKVKILQQMSGTQRVFSPWVGGSILASLGSFQQMWVSKAEYEESGKSVVEKKC
jgi:actin-related protein